MWLYLSLETIMSDFQYLYSLDESECEIDGKAYVGYGIRVQNINTGEGRTFRDVSTSKGEVERLIKLCNDLELDAIHLEDVIEDMLV